MKKGFLVDKFGKYKPVVIMTMLLNAVFHHALFMIPQQEIPGEMPSAYGENKIRKPPIFTTVCHWK